MKNSIIYTSIFCIACAGSLFYFAENTGSPIGKIQERVNPALPIETKTSGEANVTVIRKTNYEMPEFLKQTLATLWIEKARKERFENSDPEIAEIVANQQIEPCTLEGRVRMADGNCWRPEVWRKLHP